MVTLQFYVGVFLSMLQCENYRMFQGVMTITPKTNIPAFDVTGTWLYKPDTDCWYCNGSSYVAAICTIKKNWTQELMEGNV